MTAKNLDCDLAVVGGGLAGLTAGVAAAERGLKVHVFERSAEEHYPCNSRFAGGAFHLAYTDPTSTPVDLMTAINRVTHGEAAPNLAAAIAENAGRTVYWLPIGFAITASIFLQARRQCTNLLSRHTGQCWLGSIGPITAPTRC